jgi:hypothetical protein
MMAHGVVLLGAKSLKNTDMANGTPAQVANLRPWKKGESGNTHGRPRDYYTVLKLARANTPAAIGILVKCMHDDEAPWQARVAAVNVLLDRAWGRPKDGQQVDDREKITQITIVVERPHAEAAPQLEHPILALNTHPGSGDD